MISALKAFKNKHKKPLFFINAIILVAALSGCGSSTEETEATIKTWRTPQLISFANGNGQGPQIGMDANGNAIVVMFESQGGQYGIYAAHYFKNTGWLAPLPTTLLRNDPNIGDWQVAVAPNGDALSLRKQVDSSTNEHVWGSQYVYGTGWYTELYAQGNSAAIGDMPRLAIDNNKAVVAWIDGVNSAARIRANIYSSTSGWSTTSTEIGNKNANAGEAGFVDIAMASNGEAYVVMQQLDTSNNQKRIYFNRYVPGSGWGTASLVDGLSGDADYPKIAVDGSNNAISVWRQVDGSFTNLYASYRPAGGNWQAQVAIETIDGAFDGEPVVVMNSNGTAFAAWIQADGTTYSVYANRFTPTDGWGTAQLLETSSNIASDVDIAIDSNGNAFAVWAQNTTNNYRIYRNRYTVDSGWGSAELMETNNGKLAYLPKVKFDHKGNAIAVWGVLDPAVGNLSKVWASHYQ